MVPNLCASERATAVAGLGFLLADDAGRVPLSDRGREMNICIWLSANPPEGRGQVSQLRQLTTVTGGGGDMRERGPTATVQRDVEGGREGN